ncbi:MAG: DNA repair protein RecN [Intrasporangium sp.]|uniref:DNA repair protein RecN n=1 Tax=Intrasporangium sp. TaxID=1925024 RepID=UPI002649ED11|nr:DNA repair protein RecN [Intrasporangium sp.]MDN5794190.1 DNA repair protein RecN [Intrasporangium sp.]
MFRQIRLRGIGVIDEAVLDLCPGLNVVTGETGAGKTMVVSGLGLLLGQRADSGLVRSGRTNAFVEGVVELPEGHPALVRAAQAGAEHDDGELVIARTITATGRSRAHVGGRTTPVGVLAELGEHLVALHGQADQWRLTRGEAHREVLDVFGGGPVLALRDRVATLYDQWREATSDRDRLVSLAMERARQIDALTAALEEVEALDPQPGEDVALRAEDERLSHADTLRTAVGHALCRLTSDEYVAQPAPNVADLIAAARSGLGPALHHDARLGSLDDRLVELAALTSELVADLTGYLSDIELDPERLEAVQQRRAALTTLTRKYGESVEQVLGWTCEAAARLDELMTADDRVAHLAEQAHTLRAELIDASSLLSHRRHQAAVEFADRVGDELRHLAMGRAEVVVEVGARAGTDGELRSGERVRLTRHGIDEVDILLAAHPGAPPRSITKVASGGELSRVMLAIELVGAGTGSRPTFVFDEVDAGVGGRAALDVGARLARLADQAQVIVVTHLAQVAAFADRHLVVRKADDGTITSSSVVAVADEQRLAELSRMMGGDPDSDAGLAHARDLLAQTTTMRPVTGEARRVG